MNAIKFQQISKQFDDQTVLHDLSMEIRTAERVVLAGLSGCGKTTILRLIAGFLAPDTGKVWIQGNCVSEPGTILVPPERRNIGMVFQDLALWPHMTVKQNLTFGLRAKKIPASEQDARIHQLMKIMNMSETLHKYPGNLSGGQQQRVALARALILQPGILLMDEPLSSLDEMLRQQLKQEILKLHETLGFTLVYVTHRQDEVKELGSSVFYLQKGHIEKRDTL